MNRVICLVILLGFAVIAQMCFFPAFVPGFLRPDVGVLLAFLVLAFGSRELGLVCLFGAGLLGDLFGDGRFGLMSVCYLLAAGPILWLAGRDMTRGDRVSAAICALAGTGLAHLLYLILGRFWGANVGFGAGLLTILCLLLAGVVWSYPLIKVCGLCLRWTRTLSPAVQEKWAAEARAAGGRRGSLLRMN